MPFEDHYNPMLDLTNPGVILGNLKNTLLQFISENRSHYSPSVQNPISTQEKIVIETADNVIYHALFLTHESSCLDDISQEDLDICFDAYRSIKAELTRKRYCSAPHNSIPHFTEVHMNNIVEMKRSSMVSLLSASKVELPSVVFLTSLDPIITLSTLKYFTKSVPIEYFHSYIRSTSSQWGIISPGLERLVCSDLERELLREIKLLTFHHNLISTAIDVYLDRFKSTIILLHAVDVSYVSGNFLSLVFAIISRKMLPIFEIWEIFHGPDASTVTSNYVAMLHCWLKHCESYLLQMDENETIRGLCLFSVMSIMSHITFQNSTVDEPDTITPKLINKKKKLLWSPRLYQKLIFFPTTVLSSSPSNHCAICIDYVFEENEDFAVLDNCAHLFCIPCITEWFDSNRSICPYCRAEIKYWTTRSITKQKVNEVIPNQTGISIFPLVTNVLLSVCKSLIEILF